MARLRILGAEDVRAALPVADAIAAARAAFTALADGTAVQPHRLSFPVADRGTAVAMGAFVPGVGLTEKVVTVFPGNRARGAPATQALCVVFDDASGAPLALLDGASLTARRTGAASGLATDLLARRDARVGAVIGCGATGREQLLAIDAVRDLGTIRVAARRAASAAECVEAMQPAVRARLVPVRAPDDAVDGADIVCVATTAKEPVFDGGKLRAGCHVNTVGSFRLDMREVDAVTFARSRVFVDSVEAAHAEAGHLVAAEREGVTRGEDWTVLGDVVRGTAGGRTSAEEITVFVSVGQAAQDAASAAKVLEVARARGLGTEVDLT